MRKKNKKQIKTRQTKIDKTILIDEKLIGHEKGQNDFGNNEESQNSKTFGCVKFFYPFSISLNSSEKIQILLYIMLHIKKPAISESFDTKSMYLNFDDPN